MVASKRLIPLYWILLFHACANGNIFQKPASCQILNNTVCINVGGASKTVGKYYSHLNRVTFTNAGGVPKKRMNIVKIQMALEDEQFVYMTQMYSLGSMTFFFLVQKGVSYDIEYGFALFQNCQSTGSIVANNVKATFKTTACNTIYKVKTNNVPALQAGAWGKIIVRIGSSAEATLSTMCVKKLSGSTTPNVFTPNCKQPFCDTLYGNLGYAQTYGSILTSLKYECAETYSAGILTIPSDVKIKKAILRWATWEAIWGRSTTITMDTQTITSNEIYVENGHGTAYADVTGIVSKKGAGLYTFANMESNHCAFQVWSLTVVFEKSALPKRFINLCRVRRFNQSNKMTYMIKCVYPKRSKVTTVILHSADIEEYRTDDEIVINGKSFGKDVISGKDGRQFDVWKWNIGNARLLSSPSLNVTVTNTYHAVFPVLDVIEEF